MADYNLNRLKVTLIILALVMLSLYYGKGYLRYGGGRSDDPYKKPTTNAPVPQVVYNEEASEQKQKFTLSRKRRNRYGIQAAAKIRSFKNE